VDYSTALSADLAELREGTYPLNDDLADTVRSLKRDAALAVRSLVGMALTLTLEDHSVTWTSIADWVQPGDVQSSLDISLAGELTGPRSVSLALFAEKPDAFIEMAVDLSFILPAGEGRVRLDQTLTPDLTSGIRGLSDLTHLNRAVGVLIAEGHTQTTALDCLRQRAGTPAQLNEVALEVLAGSHTATGTP
jgi:hypothetical protein